MRNIQADTATKFKISYVGLVIDNNCKTCNKIVPIKITKELILKNFISLIGKCYLCHNEIRTTRKDFVYAILLSCGEGFMLDIPDY